MGPMRIIALSCEILPLEREMEVTRSTRVPLEDLRRLAARIRLNAIRMVGIQGFGYLGQALSAGDIYAALFGSGVLRPKHDRFVLSPGHYAVVFYAVAAELGLIERSELE